ncbi:hypothetical protein MMC10_007056 [Thelotrema lepadinum]|nr:hypothetical protein [Thelotrema lepadinum]
MPSLPSLFITLLSLTPLAILAQFPNHIRNTALFPRHADPSTSHDHLGSHLLRRVHGPALQCPPADFICDAQACHCKPPSSTGSPPQYANPNLNPGAPKVPTLASRSSLERRVNGPALHCPPANIVCDGPKGTPEACHCKAPSTSTGTGTGTGTGSPPQYANPNPNLNAGAPGKGLGLGPWVAGSGSPYGVPGGPGGGTAGGGSGVWNPVGMVKRDTGAWSGEWVDEV